MKIFLFLFYETAKVLVWIVRWFYYAKRSVVNGGLRDCKGPCIVVSNHPGTLMDPLNVAVLMNRRVNFLANASMFSTPFTNWFFSTFYCIKVERHKDTGGKPLQNEEAFKMATGYLTKGGCLYMAPEGGSNAGRRLNKLKTGPARIALNTEAANGFQLGLVILPFGLNYSDPGQFRSNLLTIIGEPIKVADFREEWEKDKIEAVQKLTAALQENMDAVLINATDEEEDQLLEKVETVVQNESKLPAGQHFKRAEDILIKIQAWRTEQASKYQQFKENALAYFTKLNSLRVRDASVNGRKKASPFLLLLASPFACTGYLIHFMPAFFTKKLSDKLSTDPTWIPTYKVMGGLVIYPLIFALQFWLLRTLLANFAEVVNWWKWAYIVGIVALGLVTEWFIYEWKLFCSNLRFKRFAEQQPDEIKELLALRQRVLSELS